MHIVVIGGGNLSDALVAYDESFRRGWWDGEHNVRLTRFRSGEVDVRNYRQIIDRLSGDEWPDYIVNCAAVTKLDGINTTDAIHVNAIGAANVALAARALGAHLIHVSTDYVFGGGQSRGNSVATDPPFPIQTYGLTKLWGEKVVQSIGSRHTLLRVGWLFGVNYENKAPMLAVRGYYDENVELIGANKSLQVKKRPIIFNTQKGKPTHVNLLAARIFANIVAEDVAEGVVHAAPEGDPVSWFEFLKPALPDIRPLDEEPHRKEHRPSVSGLTPTPGWSLGSLDDHLMEFMQECVDLKIWPIHS